MMMLVPVSLATDGSIEILPELLYKDMPVIISYSGFSDGDPITVEYTICGQDDEIQPIDIDGFVLHPLSLDAGRVYSSSEKFMVNGISVDGEYTGLTEGMFSVSITGNDDTSIVPECTGFTFTGVKVSGAEEGSINLLPVLSSKQGAITVSVNIGEEFAEKTLLYDFDARLPEQATAGILANSDDEFFEYGIMHQTPEQMREEMRQNLHIARIPDFSGPSAQGMRDLLPYVPYVPAERDQGNCGNCWAWASTGVVEVAHSVQEGISDRLSIQYLNSNYNGGTGDSWACEGGSSTKFASFYNTDPNEQVIPWNNTNASYADAAACPGNDCSAGTKMPAQFIQNKPGYPVASISNALVSTYTIDQSQAILNLKSQIDQNKALYYGFRLPSSSAWRNFSAFWRDQPESSLWNQDLYKGIPTDGGGHGVLLIGYNDTSKNPDEWYWEALNSWETTENRPNGLFRIKMRMDYSAVGIYYNNYFYSISSNYGPPDTHTVQSEADSWTLIHPVGNQTYPEGSSQQYITQAKPGAVLDDVVVDTISKGVMPEYSFISIIQDHHIETEGNLALGQVHEYLFPGTYTVSLRVYNTDTSGFGVCNNCIQVLDQ